MTKVERRREIIRIISESKEPVPAKELARLCDVSRQVIVQDMALIREAGIDIIATNRGYIVNAPHAAQRVFKVSHTDEQMEDELCAVVDLGGKMVNVMINHRVYGRMEARLGINSRKKVMEFMENIRLGKSSPLKNITSNYHYHTVEAENEEILDSVEEVLREKGYLVEETKKRGCARSLRLFFLLINMRDKI